MTAWFTRTRHRLVISALLALAAVALLPAVPAQAQTIDCRGSEAVLDNKDSPDLVRDCEILLAAKDTLLGSSTTTLNWSTNKRIRWWLGVVYYDPPKRVTNLNLSARRLSGSIPKELGSLSALLYLTFYKNKLSGPIPKELGNLSNLRQLVLAENELSGSIPKELGNLSNLRLLLLSRNRLSGSIPADLSKLSKVTYFYANGNSLTGTVALALSPDAIVSEGGGAKRITVTATLDKGTAWASKFPFTEPDFNHLGGSTVTVSVSGSGESGVVDFAPVADFDIVIPKGKSSASGTFTLTPLDDEEHETDETVTVSATGIGAKYVANVKLSAANEPSLTIADDDRATAAPSFDPNTAERSVNENALAGTDVGAAIPAATDADGDTLSYALGGTDAGSFDFNTNSRQITVKSGTVLDHEAKSSYAVTVSATDSHGAMGSISVAIAVTDVDEPPLAPTGLTVRARGRMSLRAAWTAPDNAGRPAIDGYDVQYREGSGGAWSNGPQGVSELTADIDGLEASTRYEVRVRATNDEGAGAWTQPVSGTTTALSSPAAPNLSATADGDTQIDLSWTAPAADEARAAVTGYRIEWSAEGSGNWTHLTTVANASTTTYDHQSLEPGTTRHYRVCATSVAGDGAWSNTASATTSATRPTATLVPSASSIAESGPDNSATLSAMLSAAATATITLTVSASPSGTVDLSDASLIVPAGATHSFLTIIVTAIDNDIDHASDPTVTISAIPSNDAVTPPDSVPLTVVDDDTGGTVVPVPPPPPPSPSPLPPLVVSNRAPTLDEGATATRTVPENTVPDTAIGDPIAVTDPDIGDTLTYALVNGGDAAAFAIDTGSGQLKVKEVLDYESKSSYEFRVSVSDGKAEDGTADAAIDDTIAVTIKVTDEDEPPDAPTGLTVTAQSTTALRAAWTAPDNTGRPAIDGYDVQYREGSSGSWSDGPQGVTVLLADIDGLEAGTRYEVRVRATNGEGAGAWTAPMSGTTSAGDNPVPKGWLARFGRTVASELTARVSQRLLVPGPLGSHLVLGGQRLDLDDQPSWRAVASVLGRGLGLDGLTALTPKADVHGDPRWPDPARGPLQSPGTGAGTSSFTPARLLTLLTDSAFHLTLQKISGVGGLGSGQWAAWGRGAVTRFSGQAGSLAFNDGEVFAGTLGVDYTQGPWLGGLAVAYNHGTGTYADATRSALKGDLRSTLTSMHPYLRWAVQENLDVWGLLGYGWGDLDLTPAQGQRVSTDIALQLGAVGARGTLAQQAGATLALKADAFLVTVKADETAGLPEVEAEAHRLRLALEGTYAQTLEGGGQLTPTVTVGLRQDGGDAETGLGVELGGGLRYTDPALGLTVEGRGRVLLAHADKAYEEWGASGTLRLDPGADGRGLALALLPAYGATDSRLASLWGQEITALAPAQGGLGTAGPGSGLGAQFLRLNAQLGYGLWVPSFGGLVTPFTEVEVSGQGLLRSRMGLTLDHWHTQAGDLGVELAGEHRTTPLGQPEQRIGLQVQLQFNGGRRLPIATGRDAAEPAPAVRPASPRDRMAFVPPGRAPDLSRDSTRSVSTVTGPRVAGRQRGAIEPRTVTKHPATHRAGARHHGKVKPRTPPRKPHTAGVSGHAGRRRYFVQLGTISTHSNAVRASMKLTDELSGVLRHHGRRLAVVESKHDGLSRVLFARAFRTRRAAAALCAAIKAHGPDCSVIVGLHSPGRDQRRLRVVEARGGH